MKIAQVSPLVESCPPKLYGGTERVVSYLTEALVAEGHEVTLFATGDSVTNAELVAPHGVGLRLDPHVKDELPHQLMMLDEVKRRADEFDVLHFHTELSHFPIFREFWDRSVTTLHGRLDLPDLKPFYKFFADTPLVSISYSQRAPLPKNINWVGNVYHGLPKDVLPFCASPDGGYLAFIGRISPEKRPDRAVEIAIRSGMPLKIAAKIDPANQSYWDDVIGPEVKAHPNIEFIGEIDETDKGEFLGNAAALLFPIDWPEPFGLVMIEAMACGTPVIAFDAGSVREVIDDARTGFVVSSVEDAVAAVSRLEALDRAGIRKAFERRFTVERMTRDYVKIYRKLRAGEHAQFSSEVTRTSSSDSALMGMAAAPGFDIRMGTNSKAPREGEVDRAKNHSSLTPVELQDGSLIAQIDRGSPTPIDRGPKLLDGGAAAALSRLPAASGSDQERWRRDSSPAGRTSSTADSVAKRDSAVGPPSAS